jgi:hypothetical protein
MFNEESRDGMFLISENVLNTNQAYGFLCKLNDNIHTHVSRLQLNVSMGMILSQYGYINSKKKLQSKGRPRI